MKKMGFLTRRKNTIKKESLPSFAGSHGSRVDLYGRTGFNNYGYYNGISCNNIISNVIKNIQVMITRVN